MVTCLVLAAPSIVSCGGDDDAGRDVAPATPTASSIEETTAATTAATPAPTASDGLGDAISAVYLAAYDDVIATLETRPESDEATALLTDLKDDYIERLVELGHQREALDETGRASVDATISSSIMALPEDTLADFQAVADHYFDSQDADLYYLIISFNTIGQYANFDLLRDQEPDEAARLGID